jgi:Cu/Ag efflux protein CusF
MFRGLIAVVVGLALMSGAAGAAEKKGKFVKYDKETKVLTINHDGAEAQFTLSSETKVVTARGASTKLNIDSFGNPKVAKPGAILAVVYEEVDGKSKVTEIRIGGREKK